MFEFVINRLRTCLSKIELNTGEPQVRKFVKFDGEYTINDVLNHWAVLYLAIILILK